MILFIILNLLGFHLNTSFAGIIDILDNSILSSCILPTNSPQFAELCSLPNEPVILFNSLTVTANMVCDYDCRCTHGANDRGGRCGAAVDSVDETFCACDYTRGPGNSTIIIVIKLIILLTNVYTYLVRQPLLDLPCVPLLDLLDNLGNIPILGALEDVVVEPLLDHFCNVDCHCSHGYPDSPQNRFSSFNGDVRNTDIFCVCGNATTIAVRE